jgi:hypothetical protein
MSRPDLISLITRLFELSTKLFSERIELAKGELRGGAAVGARRAAWFFVSGLSCAVGLVFVGLASVDALGHLINSRALRCLIVAVPFVAFGLYVLARAAADHTDDHRQERQHEDDVRPRAEVVAAHQPEQQQ